MGRLTADLRYRTEGATPLAADVLAGSVLR